MRFSKLFLAFICILLFNHHLHSQWTKEQSLVNDVIVKLFDGMREGDSAKVSSVFRPDVRMYSSYKKKTGEDVLQQGELSNFLNAIGSPHDEIWDEKIWNTEIQIDGNVAQVWTEYAFYLGDKFSHCGIDAFQLIKDQGKWKIIHLLDTRKREGCVQVQ